MRQKMLVPRPGLYPGPAPVAMPRFLDPPRVHPLILQIKPVATAEMLQRDKMLPPLYGGSMWWAFRVGWWRRLGGGGRPFDNYGSYEDQEFFQMLLP